MSTNKRAADARRVRDVEALLGRRYFVLDPERWAVFQAALDAPARPNPRLKKLHRISSSCSARVCQPIPAHVHPGDRFGPHAEADQIWVAIMSYMTYTDGGI